MNAGVSKLFQLLHTSLTLYIVRPPQPSRQTPELVRAEPPTASALPQPLQSY
jgi:hypothetical protein